MTMVDPLLPQGPTVPTPNAVDRMAILLDWLDENNVFYDKDLVKIESVQMDNGGCEFRVVALQDCQGDRVVTRIPKESVLSVRTTAIAPFLEENGLQGPVGLAIALLFELSLGVKSPWWGYLQSLETCQDLPLFWGHECSFLRNTQVDVERDLQGLREEYDVIVKTLITSNCDIFSNQKYYSFENYRNAASLVSSRAFQVDSYHMESMVPFADLYNHQTRSTHWVEDAEGECDPSILVDDEVRGEHLHLEGSDPICEECGKAGECEHDYDVNTEEALEDRTRDEYGLGMGAHLVLVDLDGNPVTEQKSGHHHGHGHDSDGCASCDENSDDLNGEEGEWEEVATSEGNGDMLSDSSSQMDSDILEMRLIRPVKSGQEVYNTYGNHSNASLLSKYGFTELDNQFDHITLNSSLLLSSNLISEARLQKYWEHRLKVIMVILGEPEHFDSEDIEAELSTPYDEGTFRITHDTQEGLYGIDPELVLLLLLASMDDKGFTATIKTLKKFTRELLNILSIASSKLASSKIATSKSKLKLQPILLKLPKTPSTLLIVKNLASAIKSIEKAITVRLNVYESTLEIDLKSLKGHIEGSREKYALILRCGEKALLCKALGAIRKLMD